MFGICSQKVGLEVRELHCTFPCYEWNAWSSKWSLSLRYPYQNTVYNFPLHPICATCLAQLILLDLKTWMIFG